MKLAACALIFATSTAAVAEPARKNEGVALGLTIGGSAASVGLIVVGFARKSDSMFFGGALSILLTPSLGEWYAGEVGGTGIGIRAIGVGIGVIALVKDVQSECDGETACTHP